MKRKEDYAPDWKAISLRTRERDGWCCKWCGVKNNIWIVRWRDKDGDGYTEYSNAQRTEDGTWDAWQEDDEGGICSETDTFDPRAGDSKPVKIVLTVAHIDHDSRNNADDNLAALCQRCHLRHDIKQHTSNAARTRRAKRIAGGQMELDV